MASELKNAVVGASTASVTATKVEALKLEGTAPLFAGLAVGTKERRLLKNQALPAQNGIFEVSKNEAFAGEGNFAGSGKFAVGSSWALVRTADADTTAEVQKGMMVLSQTNGVTNGCWVLTTDDPVEVGVTPQEFATLQAPETSGHALIKWAGGTQFSEGKVIEHGLGVVPGSVTLTAETTPGSLVEVNLAENPNMDAKQFTIVGYASLLAPSKGAEVTVQWTAKA